MSWYPWWAVPVVGLLLTSGFVFADNPQSETSDTVIVSIGGGTVTYTNTLQTGDRFLQIVPLPQLPGPYIIGDDGTQVPGDGHDDELIVTQRRMTHHHDPDRYRDGNLIIDKVHGTANGLVCICDIEIKLWDENLPGFSIFRLIQSSHILIDNVTLHSGRLVSDNSQHIILTRSTFFGGGGFFQINSQFIHIHDNNFIRHSGPLDFYDHPPVFDECWPNPDCIWNGVLSWGGGNLLVDNNYFEGSGGVWFPSPVPHIRIIHNTFSNSGTIDTGHGDVEISWNKVRGWHSGAGIFSVGDGKDTSTTWIHNNSMVLAHEIDVAGNVYKMNNGIHTRHCTCIVENNDLIGYGLASNIRFNNEYLQRPALIASLGAYTIANDNHWGTVHDPKLPPDWWVQQRDDGELILDTWYTQPIHPVDFSATVNAQDAPHWYERITGNDWPL